MIEERPYDDIVKDVTVARKAGVKLTWTPEEIASDMIVVLKQYQSDLEKYLNKKMNAPAKRARADSKILETLSKSFRIQSIKFSKNGEN